MSDEARRQRYAELHPSEQRRRVRERVEYYWRKYGHHLDPPAKKHPKPERPKRNVPASLRFRILERDGYACQYCGRSAPEVVLHVDHITPKSAGGSDDPDNLASACRDCNIGKGARKGVKAP